MYLDVFYLCDVAVVIPDSVTGPSVPVSQSQFSGHYTNTSKYTISDRRYHQDHFIQFKISDGITHCTTVNVAT